MKALGVSSIGQEFSTLRLVHPGNPYGVHGQFPLANPPWITWVLYPFSFFPVGLSFAIWITLTIVVSAWCIFKLGGDLYVVLLSLCSPAFARVFIQGQIEVIPLLGFTLMMVSPRMVGKTVGYLLLAIKPHVLGLGAIIAWLKLDNRGKLIVLCAALVLLLVTILLYGNWMSSALATLVAAGQSPVGIHIWPYGLPLGLILFATSLKRQNTKLAGLSTIFFVPYIGPHSLFAYVAVLFTMIPRIWATVAFIGLWVIALLAT